jgi:hypothetical protein
MDVTVLAIAGCPGAALLEDRLAAMAVGLPGIRVSRRVAGPGAVGRRTAPGARPSFGIRELFIRTDTASFIPPSNFLRRGRR